MEIDLVLTATLQGGGILVEGVANFEGCNIHDNIHESVCLHLELSLNCLGVFASRSFPQLSSIAPLEC